MSMTRDRGEVVFECDSCGEILETGEKNFQNALSFLKEQGWNIRNRAGQWLHFDTDACQRQYDEDHS